MMTGTRTWLIQGTAGGLPREPSGVHPEGHPVGDPVDRPDDEVVGDTQMANQKRISFQPLSPRTLASA